MNVTFEKGTLRIEFSREEVVRILDKYDHNNGYYPDYSLVVEGDQGILDMALNLQESDMVEPLGKAAVRAMYAGSDQIRLFSESLD